MIRSLTEHSALPKVVAEKLRDALVEYYGHYYTKFEIEPDGNQARVVIDTNAVSKTFYGQCCVFAVGYTRAAADFREEQVEK